VRDRCAPAAGVPDDAPAGTGSATAFFETFPGRPAEFSIESGGQRYGDPARNRPPRYFHVTVRARRLLPGREAAWLRPPLPRYRAGDAVRADTGRAELVGRPRWFGASRPLILTPVRDLAVRWRVGTVGYEMALHVWAPFRETAPTLRVLLGRTLTISRPSAPRRSAEAPSDGPGWIGTPAWVADACRSLRPLRPACPRSIPLAVSGYVEAEVSRFPLSCRGSRGARNLLSVQWSAEDPSHPSRNGPPRFLHLEVSSGTACVRWRFRKPAARPRIGMMRGRGFVGAEVVPFGRRTWGGRRGVLVLGDCYGNHLCFRWRAAGTAYQIDLHAWEPFPQAVSALRRIVSSTG
jgi:hypothetical protein